MIPSAALTSGLWRALIPFDGVELSLEPCDRLLFRLFGLLRLLRVGLPSAGPDRKAGFGAVIDDDFGVHVCLVGEYLLGCFDLLDWHDAVVVTDRDRQTPFDVRDVLWDRQVAGVSHEECVCEGSTVCKFCVCVILAELDAV